MIDKGRMFFKISIPPGCFPRRTEKEIISEDGPVHNTLRKCPICEERIREIREEQKNE